MGRLPGATGAALALGALSAVAMAAALLRSTWVVQPEQGFAELGLWWTCLNTSYFSHHAGFFQRFSEDCPSYYSDEMLDIHAVVVPGWLVAVQVMLVSGLVLQAAGWLPALLLTDGHASGGALCCANSSSTQLRFLHYSTALCFSLAGFLDTVAVVMFLLLANSDYWIVYEDYVFHSKFGDGYFLAVAATILGLLASILFAIVPRDVLVERR